jgi:SAM-dependent methyltransferase
MVPTVSVFTPSHDPKWLDECWASLESQTFTDFEWLVLLNGDAHWAGPQDPRIRHYRGRDLGTGVGGLKRECCRAANGEFLVELDHDDILTVNALDEIVNAFYANPAAGLVYSDCAQMNEDGSPNVERFAEGYGWTYRKEMVSWLNESAYSDPGYNKILGEYLVCEAKPPTPHNVSYIWYAPNHVRAFRRSTYEQVGGYNAELEVCDDADLICRMYQAAPFVHIPELLYFQRIHPAMSQRDPELNARIQAETVRIYDENIQTNALAWAAREGLICYDLGGAHNSPPSYVPIDKAIDGVDVVEHLAALCQNSVGVIRAVDFLEHVADKVTLMNEIYRVLAPGGMLLSLTPSTDGRGAFCDPTHVSYWNELSFRYYVADSGVQEYVPEVTARFRQSRLVTYFPSPWHEANNVPYVCSNLVKDAP